MVGFLVSLLNGCSWPGMVQGNKGGPEEGKVQLRAFRM